MGSGPSRLNFVSLSLLLLLAAGAYAGWKFFPHYYTAWQVDTALGEAVNGCYRVNRMSEPARSAAIDEIRSETVSKIRQLDVQDQGLQVRVRIEGTTAIAEAFYDVLVVHPRVDKTTVLHMRRRARTDVKPVQW